jgi:hypothetical protein
MIKLLAGLAITAGTLGYITWIFEDILKVPKEDRILNRSRRYASALMESSKDIASQAQNIRAANKADKAKFKNVQDFNCTILVECDAPNTERDSKGRTYAVNGTLWD